MSFYHKNPSEQTTKQMKENRCVNLDFIEMIQTFERKAIIIKTNCEFP